MSWTKESITFRNVLAATALASCLPLGALAAPDTLEIVSAPGSTIKIDGDSTVRKFSAAAQSIVVRGKAKSQAAGKSVAGGALPWIPLEMEVTLAVASLSSGERTLDKHMRENLKAGQNPLITLKLTHFEFAGLEPKTTSVKASGELTVAGVTKPIELEPALAIDKQQVTIQGKKRVLMSDFGITPPVLMLGTLKTRNEIDISYDVILLSLQRK